MSNLAKLARAPVAAAFGVGSSPAATSADNAAMVSPVVDLTQDDAGNTVVDMTQDSENVVVDMTQDVVEEEEAVEDEHTLVGSCEFSIVGIRYYTGQAHAGEFVQLVREPHNPYDRNAVRVDGLRGEKVGHIKKEQAAIIAKLMDNANLRLQLEAVIPRPGTPYTMPVKLEFYAVSPAMAAPQVSQALASQLEGAFRRRHNFQLAQGMKDQTTEADDDSAIATAPPIVQKETLNWQTQAQELDKMFDKQTAQQLQNLPEMEMPSQFHDVTLFEYQELGIRWLIHQEASNRTAPFYKKVVEKGKTVWLCEITRSSQPQAPVPIRGGILADEMGLGKTLQTIGLILSNPPSGHTYPAGRLPGEPAPVVNDENAAPLPTEAAVQSLKVAELKMVLQDANLKPKGKRDDLVAQCLTGMKQGTIPGECFPSRLMAPVIGGSTRVCTLIVCPVSVMSNWDQQIQTHVKQDVLKVDFYQGANRADLLPTLKAGQIDVLLVSYHTLASEFARIYGKDNDGTKDGQPRTKKSKQESIFDVAFHRIVLDEAHTIRSSKTKFFKAVRQVDAERKLALTGTPFVNRADDIHSLLSFLGVEPLASKEIFRRAITIPIQTGNDIGLTRLRATMAHVALRRSKASANIQLVEKEVQLRSITFPDDAHKEVYDALFGTFRLAFQAVLQDEDNQVLKNYTSIFEKILRMRQACCSATLVPVKRREAAIQTWKELSERDHGATLTAEEGVALLEKLKGTFIQEDEQLPECAVCLMEMDESQCVILRTCSHVYCGECIGRVVSIGKPMCPLCRQPFQKGDMVKKSVATTAAATREEGNEKEPYAAAVNGEFGTSAKILALVEAIKAMQPDEKGVIFSQFTSFLDLIGKGLEEAGHSITRIDGSMNSSKRIEAVGSFNSEEEDTPRFILCSLHAAGVGINLTRGNHAFMMDCWWNQAVENQAMDRIHRIGQKRPVTIIRFVMKDSIEERMVALQEAKSMQAKGSMQKLKADEQKKARLSDLKSLLLLKDDDDASE